MCTINMKLYIIAYYLSVYFFAFLFGVSIIIESCFYFIIF